MKKTQIKIENILKDKYFCFIFPNPPLLKKKKYEGFLEVWWVRSTLSEGSEVFTYMIKAFPESRLSGSSCLQLSNVK